MITKTVNQATIVECHDVSDFEKLNNLVKNMEEQGWNGRPLVVIDMGGEYKALTGSHRLAAARKAGIENIPVACVEYSTMFEDYEITIDDLKDIDDIYRKIDEYDEEAAELFSEDKLND